MKRPHDTCKRLKRGFKVAGFYFPRRQRHRNRQGSQSNERQATRASRTSLPISVSRKVGMMDTPVRTWSLMHVLCASRAVLRHARAHVEPYQFRRQVGTLLQVGGLQPLV